MSKRKETTTAPEPLEAYIEPFDDLFEKWNQREGFRRYLEGLLLPTDKNRLLRSSQESGKNMSDSVPQHPLLCWPRLLREVRAWLEPWGMLQRYWRAWSTQPPPFALQQVLDALSVGVPLFLYNSS